MLYKFFIFLLYREIEQRYFIVLDEYDRYIIPESRLRKWRDLYDQACELILDVQVRET